MWTFFVFYLTRHIFSTFLLLFQISPSLNSQLSICRPRNPAAVAAKRTSASANFALGSLLITMTDPIASPSQMIGVITCAVIPSLSSSVTGVNARSSFPACTVIRSWITCSSARLIGFWKKSFFAPPAAATTWSRSVMQTISPVDCAIASAYCPANAFSSIIGEYFFRMIYPSRSVKISNGVPSRKRSVRLISFGTTTRPRSSILLTIPVAFITSIPPAYHCFHIV